MTLSRPIWNIMRDDNISLSRNFEGRTMIDIFFNIAIKGQDTAKRNLEVAARVQKYTEEYILLLLLSPVTTSI